MTETVPKENPHAGQGPVMLDIGGDVGALVVTMPAAMQGSEVEIRPETTRRRDPAHSHNVHVLPDGHGDDHGAGHHPHVAVVNRPIQDAYVASLVFPELVEGRYELYEKGTHIVRLAVDILGGQVTTATWPP